MELFQLSRKYLAIVGVETFQPSQKSQAVIVLIKRLLFFISSILYVILSSVYIVYEAEALNQYADSFYGFASSTAGSVDFAILLWKMDSLFKLIGDVEKIVEQRKLEY